MKHIYGDGTVLWRCSDSNYENAYGMTYRSDTPAVIWHDGKSGWTRRIPDPELPGSIMWRIPEDGPAELHPDGRTE